MSLSEEKISHLAHRILDELSEDPDLKWRVEEEKILRDIKRTIVAELKLEEEMDRLIRQRLASYSRKIPEGSQEWDILYKKVFHEELKRRRRL